MWSKTNLAYSQRTLSRYGVCEGVAAMKRLLRTPKTLEATRQWMQECMQRNWSRQQFTAYLPEQTQAHIKLANLVYDYLQNIKVRFPF